MGMLGWKINDLMLLSSEDEGLHHGLRALNALLG
jgi:hypothetical protein